MNTKKCRKNLQQNSLYNLIKNIDKLCQELDNKYRVNLGGCCFITYCIAKILEDYDIYYKIIVFDGFDEIENYFNLEDCEETMYHYAILIPSYDFIINQGECNRWDYYYNIFESNSQEILNYYNYHNEQGNWNSTYDTLNNKYILGKFKQLLNVCIS
jgi:hypothetical protein